MAHKLETSYDVVAQLLNEMCDAGAVSTTEPNALRDLVEVEGWIGKLLGGINIPGCVYYLGLLLFETDVYVQEAWFLGAFKYVSNIFCGHISSKYSCSTVAKSKCAAYLQ